MTRKDTDKKYVRFKGIANHLDSIYKRLWAQFIITADESYYILDGKKITIEEMNILYPIVELQKNGTNKGKQLDGRIIP